MAEHDAADTAGAADDETAAVPDACRTQAAELAWSIDHEVVELDDPDRHWASWRRVAVIGAMIVAAAAAVAGGIIAWDRYHQPTSTRPTRSADVPAPAPAPEKPPAWHLNGAYRIEIRNPEGTIRNGATGAVETMGDLGLSTATVWQAYETGCTPTNCTARSVALDDVTHQHADGDVASLFRWNGIEWESTGGPGPNGGHTHPVECVNSPGVDTVETWGTMSPLPDGSFRGTFHRTYVKAECSGSLPGDQQDVPMVAVRIGDAPPGVFK